MQKSTIIHTLNKLPYKFNLDDFLEKLLIIEKFDEGIVGAKTGKTISHDSVKKLVAKWHE